MNERFPQLFWGMIALAVALVIGSISTAMALGNIRRAGDVVEVTGSAKRPIRADYAIWRGSLTTQEGSVAAAYRELRPNIDRVQSFLRAQGIPDSSVSLSPLQTFAIPEITPQGRETGRTIGHRVTQNIEVRSANVDTITAVSRRANDLVADGVPLMAFPPEYLYTKLADIRVDLLSAATADARERARAMAESAGGRIGGIRGARMGVFQITPRFSTEVADYGINDVSSIEKDITAVVRVSFEVK
jgi:hypothetical protein